MEDAMQAVVRPSRSFWWQIGLIALLGALAFTLAAAAVVRGRAKSVRRSGLVQAAVVAAAPGAPVSAPPAPPSGFAPQTRLGFTSGDQWEPAIAADRSGHVYVLYPQYLGVPGCPDCASPTMILQVSADGGAAWGAPRVIHPAGATGGQWDAQIVVDPVDGRTVYAAWLQNGKSDTVVAKSTDFGATWNVVVADRTNAGTDKPILAVRGPHVYVAYNHAQKIWVSASRDGGATFTSVNVNKTGKLGWALAGGGTIDPAGNVYFGWAGYEQNGGARGAVNLFISRSSDGGATWTNKVIHVSGAPPDCSAYLCGWAYLGAQVTLASDSAGRLYALWNAGEVDRGPERMYFATSNNGGQTWSDREDVSAAPPGVDHAFPAIVAGGPGDVRISWMDNRTSGPLWNTYYRSSTNGGAVWSAESDLSTFVSGFDYIQPGGFGFPFGDYYELDIDGQGVTHAVWGEAGNYDTPGSIWYTRGR
jgi:hypothetical protein